MEKAVFLDRDGVIIEQVHHLISQDKVKIIGKVTEAISMLNQEFKVIIVTNQSPVARGLCTEETAKRLNDKVVSLLAEQGARIDQTYMCFHHPTKGIGKYKINCNCRKPESGMLMEAAKEFNIDLSKSYLIGDKTSDIGAGIRAGTRTILVKTGYGGKDQLENVKSDYIAEDLYAAAKLILEEAKK